MKKLKIAALMAMTALTSLSAQADVWSTAEVKLAGVVEDGSIFLKLTHVSGGVTHTERNFKPSNNIKDLALAIGLAAVSSNRQVVIFSNADEVDDNTHPVIKAIYLSKNTTTLN